MTLHAPDREAFVDDTLTILRELDFPPSRVDRTSGEITAGPTTSGQWFEFWRRDVHGPYQLLEASIHTIRREVSVTIRPPDDSPEPDAYDVKVAVNKYRYAAPQRQVTTASGALAIYSERIPTSEGLRKAHSPGSHWVPLGRDLPLEEYLLNRIAEASHGVLGTWLSPASSPGDFTGGTPVPQDGG